MAIDFAKTQSFPVNLFRAFAANDLWTFSDQLWQEGRHNDPVKCEKRVDYLSEP